MKKTILAIALVLAMLFSMAAMTSCGSPLDGDDAIAAMQFIDEKMNAVKGFDATVTTTTMGVSVDMDMKVDMTSTDDIKMFVSMEQAIPGLGTAAVEITYVDGVIYNKSSITGGTIKQKITDPEEIEAMIGDMDSVTDTYTYASAEFVSRENGLYVIKATVSAESASELVGEVEGVTDISGTVTYECDKDGVVSKMTVESSFKLEGEEMSTKMTVTFNSLEVPTIVTPSDASEYVEAEA